MLSKVALLGVMIATLACAERKRVRTDDRVADARVNVEAELIAHSKKIGVPYPPKRVFFRAFKTEKTLEVWVAPSSSSKYVLFRAHDVAAASGVLGPKRIQGDKQVPEGIYYVDRFNPKSNFLLSLGLNYPNEADRVHADKDRPGGDIFIHGNQLSIGCLAMTDEKIEEIYLLALGAREAGQKRIPVHIFPFRMTETNLREHSRGSEWAEFWSDLKPIYDAFERTKKVPQVKIVSGRYKLSLIGPISPI
jgi:murein L,D-transpeptidase YafK